MVLKGASLVGLLEFLLCGVRRDLWPKSAMCSSSDLTCVGVGGTYAKSIVEFRFLDHLAGLDVSGRRRRGVNRAGGKGIRVPWRDVCRGEVVVVGRCCQSRSRDVGKRGMQQIEGRAFTVVVDPETKVSDEV